MSTGSAPITRDDIKAKLSEIQGEATQTVEDAKTTIVAVAAAVGVVVLVGVYQFVYVATRGHQCRVRMDELPRLWRGCVNALAWAGFAARGIILWVLGGCLAKAAWTYDPSKVRDTDKAFDFLGSVHHQVFAAVALGTIAYGIFLGINGILFRFGKAP